MTHNPNHARPRPGRTMTEAQAIVIAALIAGAASWAYPHATRPAATRPTVPTVVVQLPSLRTYNHSCGRGGHRHR